MGRGRSVRVAAVLLVLMAALPLAGQLRLPPGRRPATQPSTRPATQPPVQPTAPAADDQETTIKVDVNLVTFAATVTDGYGRYQAGLKRDHFTLYEDGVPQAISLFHDEIVPVSVGIVIDTSGSMKEKLGQAVYALEHFVDTIQPDDDVFLMQFASTVELALDFTGNRQLFRSAARNMIAVGGTRLYDAFAEALDKVDQGRHRKKAILLITDGNDTSSQMTFEEVLEAARQSEVLVYAMGIGAGGSNFRVGRRGVQWQRDKVDMRVLETIADATGGRAFFLDGSNRGGLDPIDSAAQQVSNELRQQYTVGYYPTNAARDGSYRRIEMGSRVPGLQVRHRRGYYAPRDVALQR